MLNAATLAKARGLPRHRPPALCTKVLMRLWICAAVVAVALWPGAVRAQSAADVAAARELFIEGAKLAREGKWLEASERYERSLALKRAPMTLYSLGVAQMSSGALVEALESFRAFLVEPPSPKSKQYREPATSAIEELERRVARITVVVEPAGIGGLEVTIGEEKVPTAALGRPRLVNPGAHTVSATAQGYHAARADIRVDEGGSEQVGLTLTPLPAQPQPQPAPQPAPQLPPPTPPPIVPPAGEDEGVPVLPIVLIGGGVAMVGVAVGVGIAGWIQADDAPTNDGDEADSARTKGIVADVLGAVGIAAAGVGVVLLLVGGSEDPPVAGSAHLWGDGQSIGMRLWF